MCFWINVGLKSAHVTSTFSLSSYIFSAVLHSHRSHVSYQQERLGSVHMTVSFIIGPLKQEHLIHAEAQFMSHGFLLCRNFSLYNWRSSSYSAGLLAINHILSGNVKKKKEWTTEAPSSISELLSGSRRQNHFRLHLRTSRYLSASYQTRFQKVTN